MRVFSDSSSASALSAGRRGGSTIGRRMVKVVPASTWLSTSMVPLCSLMIFWETASPRPVPWWPLVEWKARKIWPSWSSGIPQPLSAMVMM